MSQLNAFLLALIRQRWAARQAGQVAEKMDILDRILQSIEVRAAEGAVGRDECAHTLETW